MRRFMVHLVTEVDFEDGEEASDKAVQDYQKQLKDTVVSAARGTSCSGPSRVPGSRLWRSKKLRTARRTPRRQPPSKRHARPSRPADDPRQHAP